MKILLITALVILAGCNEVPKDYGSRVKFINYEKRNSITLGVICVDGVEYLYSSGGNSFGITPHYKRDGSLYLCELEVIDYE